MILFQLNLKKIKYISLSATQTNTLSGPFNHGTYLYLYASKFNVKISLL
jgi:hypothetical protein